MDVNPIYSITPFSLLDFEDHTSCIIWFAGCNMKCIYCYNPEIVYGKGVYNYQYVLDFLAKRKGLLDGVVLSGGECTLYKHIHSFVKEIKKNGFKVKIDTNGLKPEIIYPLVSGKLVDYIALDFKAMPFDFFKITKTNSFKKFEKTFEMLAKHDFPFEVRTTIHSSLISKENLQKMILFLEEKGYKNPYYLQAYRNRVKTLKKLPYSTIEEEFKSLKSNEFPIFWRS